MQGSPAPDADHVSASIPASPRAVRDLIHSWDGDPGACVAWTGMTRTVRIDNETETLTISPDGRGGTRIDFSFSPKDGVLAFYSYLTGGAADLAERIEQILDGPGVDGLG